MPLYEIEGKSPKLPDADSYWIAPSADLIGDVQVASGVSIWFNVVIRADNGPIAIGADTNVQEHCTLHSDPDAPLTVGEGVTVGHRVVLHGCTIGDHTLIGMGATIMNHAVIGAESIVGAGALVTEGKVFPPRSMILGAPAKLARELREEEVAALYQSAKVYTDKVPIYVEGLRRTD